MEQSKGFIMKAKNAKCVNWSNLYTV